MFGVPTFVTDRRAMFVRLMERPAARGRHATLERVLAIVKDWPKNLDEYEATTIPR